MVAQRKEVGFNAQAKWDWMETTAAMVTDGLPRTDIAARLQILLADKLSAKSQTDNGSRYKTVTLLLRIWCPISSSNGKSQQSESLWQTEPPAMTFHQEALELWRELPADRHLPLHWGLTIATYPFFRDVAATVGRLLRLQDTITAPQVQRRIGELYGDRERVSRSARHCLFAMHNWGPLQKTGKIRGIYTKNVPMNITETRVAAWLLEGCLRGLNTDSVELNTLLSHPSLFPFVLPPLAREWIKSNPRLNLQMMSLNQEMLMLRTAKGK